MKYSNIVVVPDIEAVELTALAKRDLKLTYLDFDYAAWDFYRDVNGKAVKGKGCAFEVTSATKKEIEPTSKRVSSGQIQTYFRKRGYTGHAGAFTEWRRQHPKLMGHHTSILEAHFCCSCLGGILCVPCASFCCGDRGLDQDRFENDWSDYWSFVAFRRID